MSASAVKWSRWDWLLLGGLTSMFAAMRAGTPGETDPYWQIRAGIENLQGQPLARPDSWSWAPVDGLFYQNSPGWNDVLAISWQAAGFVGLFAVAWISIMAFYAVVIWLSRLLGARALPTAWVLLGFTILCGSGLSARATLAAQTLLLAALGAGYVWSRGAWRRNMSRNLVGIAAMGFGFAFLGNWVHLSWAALSIVTAGAWALIFLMTTQVVLRSRITLALAGLVGLVAGTMVGPYGLDVIAQTMRTQDAAKGLVLEWVSVLDPAGRWPWLAIAILVLIISATASIQCWRGIRSQRQMQGLELLSSLTLIALFGSIAGLFALRFTLIAALTAIPVAAVLASRAWLRLQNYGVCRPGEQRWFAVRVRAYSGPVFQRILLGLLLLLIAPAAVQLSSNTAHNGAEVAAMALPRNCALMSMSRLSNVVLLARPDVKVWSDGRMDYYGRDRVQEMINYFDNPNPRSTVDPLVPAGTTCILLPDPRGPEVTAFGTTWAGQTALAQALDSSPRWIRTSTVNNYVVWVPSKGRA